MALISQIEALSKLRQNRQLWEQWKRSIMRYLAVYARSDQNLSNDDREEVAEQIKNYIIAIDEELKVLERGYRR